MPITLEELRALRDALLEAADELAQQSLNLRMEAKRLTMRFERSDPDKTPVVPAPTPFPLPRGRRAGAGKPD